MNNNPTPAQIAEYRRMRSQIVQHNGYVCYCMAMYNLTPPVEGFKILGISAPIQQVPEFALFKNPGLVNSRSANDIN